MSAQKNKIAICLIIKNEPQMIPEYVDYYLKLGADTIIIYDNDSDTPVVSDNPNVIVNKWATVWPANQMRAYHDCALRYSQEYKWIGFFDSDEYVILKKHNNLLRIGMIKQKTKRQINGKKSGHTTSTIVSACVY